MGRSCCGQTSRLSREQRPKPSRRQKPKLGRGQKPRLSPGLSRWCSCCRWQQRSFSARAAWGGASAEICSPRPKLRSRTEAGEGRSGDGKQISWGAGAEPDGRDELTSLYGRSSCVRNWACIGYIFCHCLSFLLLSHPSRPSYYVPAFDLPTSPHADPPPSPSPSPTPMPRSLPLRTVSAAGPARGF